MNFLSFTSSFYPVVFIYFLACFHFSISLSPPNSRFSLEDQLSEDLPSSLEEESTSVSPLTVETESPESESEVQGIFSGEDATTLTPESQLPHQDSENCECGIRGASELAELFVQSHEKSDVIIEQFVLNGTDSFRGEFPWLAALTRYSDVFAPKVICGASLIASNVLVTAAHCIKSQRKERLRVVFNAWKISPIDDVRRDEKAVMMKIKRLIPHPNFDIDTVENDIGLIELETPVDFTRTDQPIRPVCLPSKSDKRDYAGFSATVAGWGYTRVSGLNSPTLLKANVPIISHDACKKTQYADEIYPGMLCAGYDHGGTDACSNDSGGPLVIEEDEKSTLVGIVSWGQSCGLPKLPGVYTRVTRYLDWIQEQLKGKHSACVAKKSNLI